MPCPKIWNIDIEKDREKEKVGDSPAKLNTKKSDRELEREIKKQGRHFLKSLADLEICSRHE